LLVNGITINNLFQASPRKKVRNYQSEKSMNKEQAKNLMETNKGELVVSTLKTADLSRGIARIFSL
jgi:hypothetical protein